MAETTLEIAAQTLGARTDLVLELFDYLKDVLVRVATHPQRLIDQLTPKGWAATFQRRAAA